MKNLLLGALLSLTFTAAAADGPTFSAFTYANKLYATILGDCNSAVGDLVVDPLCKVDRATKNFAIDCDARLDVMQTEIACPKDSLRPIVLKFDLAEKKMAPEAQVLHLSYMGKTIDVQINK